jgi:hypothetical protein
LVHMVTGDDPLGVKLAQRRAREEAERIAQEVWQEARGPAVPSSLVYALQSRACRAVRLDLGELEVSVVLGGTGRGSSRPEDIWTTIQSLANEV